MAWKKREDSPEYKKMRVAVRKRDKYKCQLCDSKRKLQVHHINRYSDAILERYDPDNGITLCSSCHKKITGRESFYAPLFHEIIIHNKKKKK